MQMIKKTTLILMLAALFLNGHYFVAASDVWSGEEEITDEMIEIINNLDLLENLEMLSEDMSFLDAYEEVKESDESEFTGGNDDQ
ncbi:MAG: hypothetical protein A2Y06_06205 [Omnitrophica WOR_2 bacterium GWA2_37_7]|nr:MAG: hypothetical protein A2Y06_06205 [Omnitrophica WOR_2 bacterium GWA2_37_7]